MKPLKYYWSRPKSRIPWIVLGVLHLIVVVLSILKIVEVI